MAKNLPGRINGLLLKCAENFERGCDALNHDFLCQNNITADECCALANQMAVAIRSFARLKGPALLEAIVRGTVDDPAMAEQIATFAGNDLRMKDTVKRLKALTK